MKTPQFEGPLDLLLSLAQQGQVDLRDVEVGRLAEEYLAAAASGVDLEEATEVLWTLAALVELKSRQMLPRPAPPDDEAVAAEEPSDLQERLDEHLREYRAFKEAATALRALEDYQARVFARSRAEDPAAVLLEGVTLDDLFRAFQQVLQRAARPVREVAGEEVRVADRMAAIVALLEAHPKGVEFDALFSGAVTALVVIVTFLALLELIRTRQVRVRQEERFGPIRLYRASAP
ncbi:MAG: segregation/condensation protein A [Armatimonadota bacterium]|nr:segregation/condensation protein A [Armatimonadota bacterium]MDR7403189.1 segregation/condensation protein A [Armatimonadota bacterium]